jgi:tRNA threonylcarbamoyladenosine biosynthesis protein TsaB
MIILSLDTSSRDASIAVLKDEDVLLEYNFSSQDNLSAMLVPSLEFILKALGLHMAQIDVFGVGIGPGLFTGIRIGIDRKSTRLNSSHDVCHVKSRMPSSA